jgi:hypothetical protein
MNKKKLKRWSKLRKLGKINFALIFATVFSLFTQMGSYFAGCLFDFFIAEVAFEPIVSKKSIIGFCIAFPLFLLVSIYAWNTNEKAYFGKM